MAGAAFDPTDFVSPVTDTLSSGPALAAYATLAAAGIAIGAGVKLGPRLWKFLWKFIPS